MSDKLAERPAQRKAVKARSLSEELLDAELRELYETYGAGKVPQHLIDMARRVDEARRGHRSEAAGEGIAEATGAADAGD